MSGDDRLERALAAVRDQPDEDSARRVLADLLQERGDPRGEFLLLQYLIAERRASGADVQRADHLLRKHKRGWLAEVKGVLSHIELERGFPVSAMLVQPPPAALKRALASPLMATLTKLRQGSTTDDVFASVVASKVMRFLRSVELRPRALRLLTAGDPVAARPVMLRLVEPGWPRVKEDLQAATSSPFCSRLESLTLHADSATPPLVQLAALGRLKHLVVMNALSHLSAAAREWPALRLESLTFSPSVRFTREPGGTVVFLQRTGAKELAALRKFIPVDTLRIDLAPDRPSAESRRALERAFAGLRIRFLP